jgi:hypothetical protein
MEESDHHTRERPERGRTIPLADIDPVVPDVPQGVVNLNLVDGNAYSVRVKP